MNAIQQKISELIQSYSSCGMKMEYEGTLSFRMAASCHYQNRRGKEVKRNHQRKHVSNALLNEFARRLEDRKADLEVCTNFESLMKILDEEKIKGIGPLTLYDAGSAIGYILQPRVLPERLVYLHAGAKTGYQALVKMGLVPPHKESAPIDAFGCLEELKTLDPEKHAFPDGASFAMLVEDFLCVKHEELTACVEQFK